MNPHDLDKDPVWDLLRQSQGPRPGPRFVQDTLRAARLTPQSLPWWKKGLRLQWLIPSLAAATAAVLVVANLPGPTASLAVTQPGNAAETPSLSEVQEGLETEVLLIAADHLGSFSDDELISLIGF